MRNIPLRESVNCRFSKKRNVMILTDIPEKIKSLPDISTKIFAFLAILLIGGGIFLGYLIMSRENRKKGDLRVISSGITESASVAFSMDGKVDGKYVASRSGAYYYLPSCSGAKHIKEKNMIWLASKEDAEARGLHPAKNCPGVGE